MAAEGILGLLFAIALNYISYRINNTFWDKLDDVFVRSHKKSKRRQKKGAPRIESSVFYRNIKLEKSGDLLVYIIALSAYFIKHDKKIASSEIEFCKKHFFNFLPDAESDKISRELLKSIIRSDIPINYLTELGRDKLKYNDKLKLVDFLLGLSNCDWDSSEHDAIKQFSDSLGIKEKDFKIISDSGYDMNDKDNIWSSDWLGVLSDHYIVNKNFRTGSITSDNRQDMRLADKIYQINGLLNEKSFEDRLNDLKDTRLSDQYGSLNDKLKVFLEILSQKMDPSEISYQRYKSIFKKVYLQAINNIKQSVMSKQIINSIDEDILKKEITKLKKEGNEELLNVKEDRLHLFEDELKNLNAILVENDRAIQEMEEVTIEMSRLKGTKGEDHRLIDQAIKELDDWTQKVEAYNKRS